MEKSIKLDKQKSIEFINLREFKLIDSNTIILCIIGFLLSRSMVVDNIAPLGISFFICVSSVNRYKIPVLISTLLGTILSTNQTSNIIKYALCLIIITLISSSIKKIK